MSLSHRDLARETHNRACDTRAIHRLIASDVFQISYAISSEVERLNVTTMIRGADKSGVILWIEHTQVKTPAEMSLRELRTIGQRLGVHHYSNLPKSLLLSEIANATKQDQD